MTDEDAFLRKLLDSPADDVVRLVYADWLDERGDTAKAEFLRLETETGQRKQRRKQVAKRLQELAADLNTKWLAVVSKLQIENCPVGGTRVEFPWQEGREKPTYLCPKRWEQLQPTRENGVRFCENCQENVYYCDTIQVGRDHVEQGHCVVVDLGVIRKARDLEPRDTFTMGRFTAEYYEREEERLRLDAVSEKREQAKRRDDPV